MGKYIETNIPSPRKQALVLAGAALLFMLVGKIAASSELFPWLSSGAFMLFYVVSSNGASIFVDNYNKYVKESIQTFAAFVLSMVGTAWLVSGISIYDAGHYRTIYVIMILAYFSLLGLCFMIRKVVDELVEKDKKIHHRE